MPDDAPPNTLNERLAAAGYRPGCEFGPFADFGPPQLGPLLVGRRDPELEREVAEFIREVDEIITDLREENRVLRAERAADDADAAPKPADEMGEADLVLGLLDAGLPTPAKLVEFMIGRRKATFAEVILAVYGQAVSRNLGGKKAQESKLRGVITRTHAFLADRESRITYRLASGHIRKRVSGA